MHRCFISLRCGPAFGVSITCRMLSSRSVQFESRQQSAKRKLIGKSWLSRLKLDDAVPAMVTLLHWHVLQLTAKCGPNQQSLWTLRSQRDSLEGKAQQIPTDGKLWRAGLRSRNSVVRDARRPRSQARSANDRRHLFISACPLGWYSS